MPVLAVLCVNIRGFVALAELQSPSRVAALLDTYYEAVADACTSHHGWIVKYMGDQILVAWNVPDGTADAVSGALAVLSRTETLNESLRRHALPPIRYGIGLHVGEVAFVEFGGATNSGRDIVGDTVNVAVLLGRAAGGGEILASETLISLLKTRLVTEEMEPLRLRQRRAPLRLYRVFSL